LGVQAARRGYRVALATAPELVNRLARAKGHARLDDELERLRRRPPPHRRRSRLHPLRPHAAAPFFALIANRYERASLIVSSNKTYSAWAEIFGDPVAVAAMVDRLVHRAEVHVLQGDSYRFKDREQEVHPTKTR
jgi:DNA replication protein DnaC